MSEAIHLIFMMVMISLWTRLSQALCNDPPAILQR